MGKKTKIIWFVRLYHPTYLYLLEKLAEQENIDLCVVFRNRNIKKEHKFKTEFTALKNLLFPSTFLVYTPNFKKEMAGKEADIVIVNLYYALYSFQIYEFAKKLGAKFIIVVEEKRRGNLFSWPFFKLWDLTLGRIILKYTKKILSLTKDSRKFMQNIVKNKEKVELISPGINANIFYLDKEKARSPEDKMRFLMVAKMKPYKDHATLLQALKYLKEQNFLNFELSLLGSRGSINPLQKRIEKMIKDYGLENRVKFLNRVSHKEMRNVYKNHDVLVLPSRGEPIGMVVPEAMACGLPVIVSDTVGVKDYVIEGENGLIFKTGDYKDLAEKIIEIYKMDIGKMGESAADHIAKNYNINKVADNFYRIIMN